MTRCCEASFTALAAAIGNRTIPAFSFCPWCGRFLGDALALEMIPGAQAAAADLWAMGKRLESAQVVQEQAQAFRKAVDAGEDAEEARRALFDSLDVHEALEKALEAQARPDNSSQSPEDP